MFGIWDRDMTLGKKTRKHLFRIYYHRLRIQHITEPKKLHKSCVFYLKNPVD